jgi:hypothetical protein
MKYFIILITSVLLSLTSNAQSKYNVTLKTNWHLSYINNVETYGKENHIIKILNGDENHLDTIQIDNKNYYVLFNGESGSFDEETGAQYYYMMYTIVKNPNEKDRNMSNIKNFDERFNVYYLNDDKSKVISFRYYHNGNRISYFDNDYSPYNFK